MGIDDKDNSAQAQAKRRISGFAELDGIEFIARMDIGSDTNGEDKNEVRSAVTPSHRDYAQLMGHGGAAPMQGYGQPPATSAPQQAMPPRLRATPHPPRNRRHRKPLRPPVFPGVPAGPSEGERSCGCVPVRKPSSSAALLRSTPTATRWASRPPGAGKTIMLSAVTGEMIGDSAAKACVLAHRDELTDQNRGKFARVNPGLTTSVVDANAKSWAGQVTFAMVPTLARIGNLAAMPKLDLLVIDEAHHAVAASYRRIIDHVRNANPDARIFGVTATPNRGDKKGLREVFDNVADQVRLGELIASGHLVPPRTFVIDVGVQDKLRAVRKTLADFDMAEVASIMDRAPVTDEVIRHWKEKAGDRQTVVFCSTVAHAAHVTEAFNAAGMCLPR